jgi:hypothetical protein
VVRIVSDIKRGFQEQKRKSLHILCNTQSRVQPLINFFISIVIDSQGAIWSVEGTNNSDHLPINIVVAVIAFTIVWTKVRS